MFVSIITLLYGDSEVGAYFHMLAVDIAHVVLSVVCEPPNTAHQGVTLIHVASSTILTDARKSVLDNARDVTLALMLSVVVLSTICRCIHRAHRVAEPWSRHINWPNVSR